MAELATAKKNKINISDYDYKKDIDNRLLLSSFKECDLAVLEEILFSPIRTTVHKIAKNLLFSEEQIMATLIQLEKAGLVTSEADTVVIDKEMRKYFEVEVQRFEPDFQPDMEFIQQLLKKIPIHLLMQWYAISKTSNNLFSSLIEKYLVTPQVFQRYLSELSFQNPVLIAITQTISRSTSFEISGQEIQEKYNLSPSQFQEVMLYLEFHLICTVTYRKQGEGWASIITPFREWKDHLTFLKNTTVSSLDKTQKLQRYRPHDFSFVLDIATLLSNQTIEKNNSDYLNRLFLKIENMGFAKVDNTRCVLSEKGNRWLKMKTEDQAIYLYRNPTHSIKNERIAREIEKSILRILNSGWVDFSDFLTGVIVPTNDNQWVSLQKNGKFWRYQRPTYSPQDIQLIQTIVLGHLFESGITAIGSLNEKPYLCVTPFGQSVFG